MLKQLKPIIGNFVNFVGKDIAMLGITYEEVSSIKILNPQLKETANTVACKRLLSILKKANKKLKHIHCKSLSMQPYQKKSNMYVSKESTILKAFGLLFLRGEKQF